MPLPQVSSGSMSSGADHGDMSSLDPAIQSLLSAQQGALQNQIGFAVAAKQLDAARQHGDAMNTLLEKAVQLSKAVGAGENFDAQA